MTGALRQPGAILRFSCYELGHQPLGLAWPRAFLERAGYAPETLGLAVEPFDADKARRARLVAISVPMHTALRLGVRAADQVRRLNGSCRIVFYGLASALDGVFLNAPGPPAGLGRAAGLDRGALGPGRDGGGVAALGPPGRPPRHSLPPAQP